MFEFWKETVRKRTLLEMIAKNLAETEFTILNEERAVEVAQANLDCSRKTAIRLRAHAAELTRQKEQRHVPDNSIR